MKSNVCVDAGSIYCPCYLAETKDCIVCSHLGGDDFCDCTWQGVCIYQNFMKNNEKINEIRKDILCNIKRKTEIEKNIYLLEIEIPKNLALELVHPGSYVLLRGERRKEEKFNSPISVMNINLDENILSVVIEEIGPKTKDLLKNKKVYIKGPYGNGIFGLKYLKKIKDKKAILMTRGLSSVTLVNVTNQLLKNNNDVKIFIDKNGKKLLIVEEILKNKNIKLNYFDFSKEDFLIKNELKKELDLVFSAGSNSFNKKVMNLVDEVDEKIPLAITNNNLICCGEGLCGACIVNIKGEKIKTCKTQVEPRIYLKEALK
ncbi:sulfide/dihydroorotate dehydrogenase-like FAD/NAD-binding protein [Tepidibacter formicigenes]|jgi:NAD(P)H-flavin reductase|uniref:NAD(P)H-flavin reductase n=1 Tax=Tepidibacter formicigenes DSM 15518 TaxID=1123349 RepID=A0A1M6LNC2_9FIRM|nr:sulfide/dihydroorotate dehydrogenase-like FAD/NAD-binding protein [Tepidibacter formicigenes]SHJ72721.1 NAD(P)H-flavin reductase [Tepidibacter formicigenes DSM 15518]